MLPGFKKREVIGHSLFNFLPGDTHDLVKGCMQEALESKKASHYQTNSNLPNGQAWWSTKIVPLNKNGQYTGLLFICTNVTETKKAQDTLRESKNRFEEMANLLPVIICEMDTNGNLTYVNKAGFKVFGYTQADFKKGINVFKHIIHPEDKARAAENLKKIMQGISGGKNEYRMRSKSGAVFPFLVESTAIYKDGRLAGFRSSLTDITDWKKAEEKIKASLKEKDILLREIQHRVKNNLQVIASLLNLQKRHITDLQGKEALNDCLNRIQAVSMIHEKLKLSQDRGNLNFAKYIRDISIMLRESYGKKADEVCMEFDLEEIQLELDTATPLSLIFNELMANSLKHAFPSEQYRMTVWEYRKLAI
jgi:PAS domain S-box-containing protein